MSNHFEEFEDRIRLKKTEVNRENQYSRYCDFIYYQSSINPELTLAMCVLKPEKPSYILAGTHGWHMSVRKFEELAEPDSEYLKIQVDMRGRAFSDGKQDCNGLELIDVIDAIEYVKEHYAEYILDKDIVFFQAGSGGGGNAFSIAGKFPDYFAHIVSMSGMSDYALWYEEDSIGEFRDEMDVWIGDISTNMAYASRSGITLIENLCSPMAIVHGDKDIRVPEKHSANFLEKARMLGKGNLVSYLKLAGVGGQGHYENITDAQRQCMNDFCEAERRAHAKPVEIPRKGRMIIGGYLFTKHFSVMLNSIDKVAEIEYDLDEGEFHVHGVTEAEYKLER